MVESIPFRASEAGSLGVEMEWMCVEQASGRQIGDAPHVFAAVGETPRIKPELFTSIVEINTDIHCRTEPCMAELQHHYDRVDAVLAERHSALLSTGTHPFSHWRDQVVSEDARYARLLERLQWVARRFNICGIHVHIGMPDADTCIRAMNRLLPIMPVFLAISANSPFWHGEVTGLAASRIKIFEGLSQGGMPFYFSNWRDFEHCSARLKATDSIDSVRDIWWEMRPYPDFGTLEVRIGDMPGHRDEAAAYIAYVRAEAMAATIESMPRVHPSLIRENRWRACRYGLQATIIDPFTEELMEVVDWLERRLQRLSQLGIAASELDLVARMLPRWREHGGGAELQRRLFERHAGEPGEMIAAMRAADGWQR